MKADAVPVVDIEVEAIDADELHVGDRVLVECEIVADDDDYPPGSHVHARPVRDSLWLMGQQRLWTWSTPQKGHSRPFRRIVRPPAPITRITVTNNS